MNELVKNAEKRITLPEIARITGASYRTVANYAQKAGWTQNGKRTYLTEEQSTLIIEAMRTRANAGIGEASRLASHLQGVETGQSKALRIEMLKKQLEAEGYDFKHSDALTIGDFNKLMPAIVEQVVKEAAKALIPAISTHKGMNEFDNLIFGDSEPSPESVEKTESEARIRLCSLVKKVGIQTGVFGNAWTILYDQYDKHYHTNIRGLAREKGKQTLDYIQQEGRMVDILAFAIALFELSTENPDYSVDRPLRMR